MPDQQQVRSVMGPYEWAMLITLSILWGGSFFFNAIAVQEVPTFTIVLVRVGLAALALHIFLILVRRPVPLNLKIWIAFFGMGLLNNAIPFTLIVWGQTHIASGLASILNATTPIFTVLLAHFFTGDEKLTPNRLAGVILGFCGVAVMIGGDVLTEIGLTLPAQLACIAAAVSYGLAGVFGRRFRAMGVSALHTATGQVTASTLLLFPLVLIVDQPWTLAMPSIATLLALLGIGIASTAFAYILFFKILERAGATNIALATLLVPVSAVLLGIMFLQETLELRQISGFVLIALGLAAIDGRLLQVLRRR